jgi:hypothetical protein
MNYPKLHNATWPGVVGKGADSEPLIPFDTMLDMTAKAEVNGVKFDGIDIGLFDPDLADSTKDGIKKLADKVAAKNLNIGSLVAAIWPPSGGSAMGSKDDRARFVSEVKKGCEYGKVLRDLGVRKY